MRWPHLIGYLSEDFNGKESVLATLERLASTEGDSESWTTETLSAANISERRIAELAGDDDVRELLRSEPAIGPSAAGFL